MSKDNKVAYNIADTDDKDIAIPIGTIKPTPVATTEASPTKPSASAIPSASFHEVRRSTYIYIYIVNQTVI
jgi:hypothetical protein